MGDYSWRDGVEIGEMPDVLGDLREHALSVVLLAEEPAVERHQPGHPADVREGRHRGDRGVHPAARAQDGEERGVAVPEHIDDEAERQRRHQGQQRAARDRVSDALPDDQPDIEDAVPQNRVGQRDREQQQRQRPHRHDR